MTLSRLPAHSDDNNFLIEHAEYIFNSSIDGVCILDEKGCIRYMNHEFGRLFNVTFSSVYKMNIKKIVQSNFIDQVFKEKKNMACHLHFSGRIFNFKMNPVTHLSALMGYHITVGEEKSKAFSPKYSEQEKNPYPHVIGKNPKFIESLILAHKASKKNVNVLLRGESGTGKELIARQIHTSSLYKDGPFIAINCAAIPENLIESELFGHEEGAFTGANKQKKGHFEMAQGGTIFLDEIGDLPLLLQVKLLRVLQEKCIRRIGGQKEIPVDVRVIAATHQDLETMIKDKLFREDLYYRLNVIEVDLVPLRHRIDDLSELIDFYLEKMILKHGTQALDFHDQAREILEKYEWPGNIRELINTIERAVIMADGPLI